MTEKELIEGCLKNNRTCQEALYRKYSRKLLGICLRYAKSDLEAEDMMQEAFIKIFRNLDKYAFTGSFDGWLKRLTINVSIEHYRKNKRLIFVETIHEEQEPVFDTGVLDKLSASEITGVINRMPEGYRVVFNLYAIEGFTHKEIAEMLAIAEGTSKSQYARAKNYLVRLLKSQLNINDISHVSI